MRFLQSLSPNTGQISKAIMTGTPLVSNVAQAAERKTKQKTLHSIFQQISQQITRTKKDKQTYLNIDLAELPEEKKTK